MWHSEPKSTDLKLFGKVGSGSVIMNLDPGPCHFTKDLKKFPKSSIYCSFQSKFNVFVCQFSNFKHDSNMKMLKVQVPMLTKCLWPQQRLGRIDLQAR
jgi:hypothetical protein